VNPKTGKPAQSPADWAKKAIFKKTDTRLKNLSKAVSTRPSVSGGSKTVPTLAELKGIKHVHFVIDAKTPAVKAAVVAALADLRAAYPGWTFTAEFGISVNLPPVPDEGVDQVEEGE